MAGAGPSAGDRLATRRWTVVALAIPPVATALFGVSVEGATRWIAVGPLTVQVGLVIGPPLVLLYARDPDAAATAVMALAALALAFQPDRAVAGALMVRAAAVLLAHRNLRSMLALGATMVAFAWTLVRSDTLPAVSLVNRVLYSAFAVHPLAGAAVLAGSAMLLLPGAAAFARGSDREVPLAFGAFWLGVVAAAALGDYPTPLVGYSGAAILGCLLSVALPPCGGDTMRRVGSAGVRTGGAVRGDDQAAGRVARPT